MGDHCVLALDISEHLFKLTTESLRLHSNETRQHQTLENLLADRLNVPCALEDHAIETLGEHLSAIPTTGDIRVDLDLTRSSADRLDAVKERISQALGREITLGDTLSIVLFHYVISQKAARVLQRIGFDCSQLGPVAALIREEIIADNVVQLR